MSKAVVQAKRCCGCKTTKDATHFQKNRAMKDGLTNYCKPCWRTKCREYSGNPQARKRTREYCRKFRQSESGKKYLSDYVKKLAGTPRQLARSAVYVAVMHKKVIPRAKSLACLHCGKPASGYHHHKGYDRDHWLDVIPLCRVCHATADRLQREAVNAN